MWDLRLIKEPSEIFNLKYNEIKKLDGWGELSIKNLKNAIEKARHITLDKLIFIGIRHIGQENAKIIAGYFGTIDKFKEIFDKSKKNNL